jgi:hypothetical protein
VCVCVCLFVCVCVFVCESACRLLHGITSLLLCLNLAKGDEQLQFAWFASVMLCAEDTSSQYRIILLQQQTLAFTCWGYLGELLFLSGVFVVVQCILVLKEQSTLREQAVLQCSVFIGIVWVCIVEGWLFLRGEFWFSFIAATCCFARALVHLVSLCSSLIFYISISFLLRLTCQYFVVGYCTIVIIIIIYIIVTIIIIILIILIIIIITITLLFLLLLHHYYKYYYCNYYYYCLYFYCVTSLPDPCNDFVLTGGIIMIVVVGLCVPPRWILFWWPQPLYRPILYIISQYISRSPAVLFSFRFRFVFVCRCIHVLPALHPLAFRRFLQRRRSSFGGAHGSSSFSL